MKYNTMLEVAHAVSSKAKTSAGIRRAFLKNLSGQPISPIHSRGNYYHRSRMNWENYCYDLRAEKITTALGLLARDVEESIARQAESYASELTLAQTQKIEWPHRVPTSRWAGGNFSLDVQIGEPEVEVNSYTEWSRNGKWSGLSARACVTVTARAIQVMGGNLVHNGHIVLDVDPTPLKGGSYKAIWTVQTFGLQVKTQTGYITPVPDQEVRNG